MSIDIIGSGIYLARVMSQSGTSVTANSRGRESLMKLAAELEPNVQGGSFKEAAEAAMVVLAVPWIAVEAELAKLGDMQGRILIDASDPVASVDPESIEAKDPPDPRSVLKAVDTNGRHSS